jgi:hypothetical protein
VAEEKVTLPCHHQLGLQEKDTLDIEWLLTDNEGKQKVVSIHLASVTSSHPLWLLSSVFPVLLGLKEPEWLFIWFILYIQNYREERVFGL